MSLSSQEAFSQVEDAALKIRVFRKITLRFLPLLTISFIVAYIDRTNVGFAALTMNRDLGLTEFAFGWGAGLLFFSYCLFEVPSNSLLHRYGARRWLARIMITWGIVAAATAFISGAYSFFGMRFLLGLAKAGFTPGAMYFFANWYPPEYRSRIIATFQLGVSLASLISGPLSAWVLTFGGAAGLSGWQWLFIAEGLPAVGLGLLVLKFLSDTPGEANWLTDAEKQVVAGALRSEQRDRPVHDFWAAMADSRVLILAGIQFGFTIGSYAVGIWLPLILKQHQLPTMTIGWLVAIPYLFGCVVAVLWSTWIDRSGSRTPHLIAACMIGAVGLLISIATGSLPIAMLGLTIAVIGITSARGIFWSIPPRFLTGRGSAGGLALINSLGTFGGFVGPIVMGWLKQATGSFNAGLSVMALLMAASASLTLLLRMRMRYE